MRRPGTAPSEVAVVSTEYRATFKMATLAQTHLFPLDKYECCATCMLMPQNVYAEGMAGVVHLAFEGASSAAAASAPCILDVCSVAEEWGVFDPARAAFMSFGNPHVQLHFCIRRKFATHLWNSFSLICLITSMNFTAWCLEASRTSERLALWVTVTLALCSLKFALTGAPPTSKPNWQDFFLNVSVLFTLACMVVSSCLVQWTEVSRARDFAVMVALASVWGCLCSYVYQPAQVAAAMFGKGREVVPRIGPRCAGAAPWAQQAGLSPLPIPC